MKRPLKITDLAQLRTPGAPAVSPDGQHVVYAVGGVDGDTKTSSLWLVATSGGEPRQLTQSGVDSAPVWNAAGNELAFLRSSAGAAPQLWTISPDGGEPVALTNSENFPLGAGAAVWSPGGGTVVLSAPTRIVAGPPNANEPIVINRLDYKSDGVGYLGNMRLHLHEITLANGAVRQLTDGDWNASAPAISPDGTKLAFAAALDEDRDTELSSHVWYLELADPLLTRHRVGQAGAMGGPLLWSQDGESVIGIGLQATQTRNAGLWRLHLDAAQPDENLTASLDRNIMPGGVGYPGGTPQLLANGDILFAVRMGGNTHLYRHSHEGRLEGILTAEHTVISGLSHGGGTTAVVVTTHDTFAELAVVGSDGQLTVLTSIMAQTLPDVELITSEPRTFTISDGESVAGWLIRDESKQNGPAPLLLDIHGGPHNAWTGVADASRPYHQELAAKGWTILILNPRGSDGYGEAFLRGTLDGWGTADHNDWMEPIDVLISEGAVDPDRLAVTGYSYGGFGTCSLTSTSNRFAAAVAGGLVADLGALPGASDAGVYLSKTEFDGDDTVAAALSPMNALHQVTTPTLILHGAQDNRCPVNQAEQWFAGLRRKGVPAQMVLYPGQSHSFIMNGPLSHRLDYSERLIAWLELHVPAAAQTAGETAVVPALLDTAYWQHRLETAIAKYDVPGAVFGILRTDAAVPGRGAEERVVIAAGVTNKRTGEKVTPASLFQLGSITKTWTATLIMQLVAEGKLDLDAPIRDVLPDFKLADENAAATITMRQLLTHTSGIDGDIFTDTGAGDDCVEKYVDALSTAEQVFAPGQTWSYCNTGFGIAGRVIEVLRGKIWNQVLADHIYAPLKLSCTTTLAEETALHSFAVGHLGLGSEQKVTTDLMITRSAGPAGLISSSVDETLTYARTFMPGGTPLMPAEQLAEMVRGQVNMSHATSLADEWALGWCLQKWGTVPTINHNGATFGQNSYLRLFPEQGIALFLSVNGGRAENIHRELFGEAAQALAGATIPAAFNPAAHAPGEAGRDAARLHEYAGVYEAAGLRIVVEPKDDAGNWKATAIDTSGHPSAGEPQILNLVTAGAEYVGARVEGMPDWVRISFESHGGTKLMHFGTRVYPQVANHN
ncbi:serine hydrolase [Arthrobacter sp. GMC3]|uniref:serine hydrolase n=1 Tax=Arthrobacter sp. GMC3 TaxID=2058894 RepID=UPI000CE569B6|nr:serine hydrolase [Arthrobacter sp. GMC3]